MSEIKRFYKQVDIASEGQGYVVRLDGRVLKTPGKVLLIMPDVDMAKHVAAEWDAQAVSINPAIMPCTRLLNVAIERVPGNRGDLVKEVQRFAATDLLCYRDNDPKDFAALQSARWDPVLSWAKSQGISLKTTNSLIAIEQEGANLDRMADYARQLDDVQLALLAHFTNVFGSAVLGMAVMEAHLPSEKAFTLSRLAEDWQISQWGEDEDAKIAAEALRAEVIALSALIRPRPIS